MTVKRLTCGNCRVLAREVQQRTIRAVARWLLADGGRDIRVFCRGRRARCKSCGPGSEECPRPKGRTP